MKSLVLATLLAAAPNHVPNTDTAVPREQDAALQLDATFNATTAAAALNIDPEIVQAALAADDIRDLRRGTDGLPWWPVLPALAAALVAVALLRRRRSVTELTPRARATAMLEAAKEYLVAGDARKWAFASSDAVRYFLEAQFQIEASARTTDEILTEVADSQGPIAERVQAFLRSCDEAKFGNRQLSPEAMARLQQTALDVVSTDTEEREAA